jgi:hypothetical protein
LQRGKGRILIKNGGIYKEDKYLRERCGGYNSGIYMENIGTLHPRSIVGYFCRRQ